MRNCRCIFGCDTYECMKDEYCEIPKWEMVLDVGGNYFCKVHGAKRLLELKRELDTALEKAEELGWELEDE